MATPKAVDVSGIIAAAKNRTNGWVEEYRAHAAHRSTPAKVAAALSASDYLRITGASSVSEQTVRNYRTAWALASAFPEVAAHVGNGGQIHKMVSYAIATPNITQEDVMGFIAVAVDAVNKAEDKEGELRSQIAAIREVCKAYREEAKNKDDNKDDDGQTDTPDTPDMDDAPIEAHPQELADAALLAMMNAARDYVAAIEAGAEKDAANLMELSRILSPLSKKKAVA
jgi:hypothetical protein